MLDTDSYLPILTGFEGSVPFMYLDTTGNVTVGVGSLLASVAAAQALPFVLQSDGATAASADQIATDFNTVHQQPEGRNWQYYKQFTTVMLTSDAIQNLLKTQVSQFLARLTAATAFPDYNSYPNPACAAVLDMAYNLGLGKLLHSFPTFCQTIRDQDWGAAAGQCHRLGIGDSRNNWTHDQLLASVPPPPPDSGQ